MEEILLVGNPNAGKTTLYNSLTSSNEHIGNWHGVTVENKEKCFKIDGQDFSLVDTPGIYSLCPLSFEEQVTVKTIFDGYERKKVINICDQNNLRRNLYLTLCLLERGCDVVLVVNEIDKKPIFKIDCQKLSDCLGIDVVMVNAEKKIGIDKLKGVLLEKFKRETKPKNEVLDIDNFDVLDRKIKNKNVENEFRKNLFYDKNYNKLGYLKNIKIDRATLKNIKEKLKNGTTEKVVNNEEKIKNDKKGLKISEKTQKNQEKTAIFDDFYSNIKLYEKDEKYFAELGIKDCQGIFSCVPENSMQILANLRYDFINTIISKCTTKTEAVYGKSKIDKIILNKWLAFPIFVLILSGIFYLTFFSLGGWLSDLLGNALQVCISPILNMIESAFGQSSAIYNLFNVAIFGGVGMVLSFLPQVVLLFFFLSVLEDSGYMSRVAFIFEDILGKIGLSGKSVYTLLMGFGCSTTAIMTARNMEDKNAKIKTAILCPYMSCSAKIPIYTVIGGAFFGVNNIFCIVGLYFLGVAVAILISTIFEKTVLKSKKQSFILEFPPYRKMSFKRVGKVLWKNSKEFLVRVGTVMIAMNIIIWVLSSFSFTFKYVANGDGVSMLETIGKILSPIFKPLGFGSWAIVASLLAGLVAKEVVISSIAMFNGIDASVYKLVSQSIIISTSAVYFASNASVISFLVFCLLYTPCIASISMLIQEIGAKWTFISVLIQLFTAYVVSFVIYNIFFAFEVFGFVKPFVTLVTIIIILIAVYFIVKKLKNGNVCAYCESCNKKCLKKQKKH